MEPPINSDTNVWANILQTLGTAFIYAIVTAYTAYKAIIAFANKWIAAQVKTSTDFVDMRISLQLKSELEGQKQENKELRHKIEAIEHDYKLFNEERIKEMKEFFKEYK